MSNHIINILDDEMSCEITSHIRSKGVDIVLGTAVYSIEEHSVTTGNGTVIPADLVVLSTGVEPVSYTHLRQKLFRMRTANIQTADGQ